MATTCRGVTKQGEPCLISWGLDADGLCKYHALGAGQCLGIARTSGQRCRVKWDLDDAGYCVHHRSQAPLAPASALPGACRGVTKRGSPCSVTWALDADGFCKFHAPNASQCKGLARASGRRCKIKWGLDARGYCQFHQRVDAPVSRQCEAALPATGRRCPQTVGIDADGFCTAHGAVKTELPLCMGTRPDSDERCGNNAKTGYDFCCAAHDLKFAASFVAPSVFNDPGLRSSVEAEVVKKFKGRDLYHGDKLDHILEKQCFAYAFQRVEFRDGEEEAQDVALMLREEIVNELPNLCLTRTTTNKMKGAAVSMFLDDSMTGHRGLKTFTDYMLAQKRDDTRLARDVTRTIRSEMGSALRRCQWKLADAGETPALDALSAELQQLYVDMDLHTSRSGKTKPRAAVTVESKVPVEDQDDEYVKGKWDAKVVAIKKLHAAKLTKKERKMFIRETLILGMLGAHPNIVQLYGYTLNPVSLVMEYVPKSSLSYLLHYCEDPHTEAKMTDGRVKLNILLAIAYGMAQLHECNVTHGDLKPQNVLITDDFHAKIADFGLATFRAKAASTTSSHMLGGPSGDGDEDVDFEGIAGGTAAYMAPELLSSSMIANEKTDVYSFGVLMNEVLHEEEPYQQNLRQFVGKGPFAAVLFAKAGNRPQIRDKKVTPELKWIIERCWSQRPGDRPTFDKISKLLPICSVPHTC